MRNVKLAIPLLLMGALSGVTTTASALDWMGNSQVFIGGGVGYGRMNGEDYTNTNGDLTKSRVSWKGMIGARLTDVMSLEGQYIDFGAANRNDDRIQATGWTADAILDLTMFTSVKPYLKVGALFWETDNRFNNISRDDDGTDVTFGAGLRFPLTDNLSLRTEYERFNMDKSDVDNFSLNLLFDF